MTDQAKLTQCLGIAYKDKRVLQSLEIYGAFTRYCDVDVGYEWLEFKSSGISVMFSGAGAQLDDSLATAFYLHREGHAGYKQFHGNLDGGIIFGDTINQIEAKLGFTGVRGGGGPSTVIKGLVIPQWLRFKYPSTFSHYQFDEHYKLEMLTVSLSSLMGF